MSNQTEKRRNPSFHFPVPWGSAAPEPPEWCTPRTDPN